MWGTSQLTQKDGRQLDVEDERESIAGAGMHIYAPGVEGYRPVTLALDEHPRS